MKFMKHFHFLKFSCHIRMNQRELQSGIYRDILDKLPIGQIIG